MPFGGNWQVDYRARDQLSGSAPEPRPPEKSTTCSRRGWLWPPSCAGGTRRLCHVGPGPRGRVISACRDPTPQHRVKARVIPSTISSPSTPALAADRSLALKAAGGVLFVAVVGLSWVLGHGLAGPGYLVLYALLLMPGLPLGCLLFGRGTPAGWIAGALIGYGLSAIVLWIPVDLDHRTRMGSDAWAALDGRDAPHGQRQSGWRRPSAVAPQ